MTDDEIRSLIASLPVLAIQIEDDYVAIEASHVTARSDRDRILDFLENEGSYAGETDPVQLVETGENPRDRSASIPPTRFIAVPRRLTAAA